MALPGEVLLDVVGCLNHDLIVIMSLAGKAFRDLAEHYATHCLPARRLRVSLSPGYFKIDIGRQTCILSCCSESNCTEVLCTRVHAGEALQKFRSIIGFDGVERIETCAYHWNDGFLQSLSHNLPSLRRSTTLLLSTGE